MPYAIPAYPLYSHGFATLFAELRTLPGPIEPDLLLGLHGLLRASGVTIDYSETDVLSGHAAQFIYSREHPECSELAYVPPADTLFRALDVTWKEVIPSGPSTAYKVLHEWLKMGRLVLARFREPLLIYGYEETVSEPVMLAARLRSRLVEEKYPLSVCDKQLWRYPFDEGNVLMCVNDAPRHIADFDSLIFAAAHRAVRLWHTNDLAGCATGDQAYRRLSADIADPDVDFTDGKYAPWMGRALWKQWTARVSSQRFFERVSPRFGGAERATMRKVAFCYGQCADAWKQWARVLGPTWDYDRCAFSRDYPDEFIQRWKNPEARAKGAHWIEEARGWEDKAMSELMLVIR
jgi:hypothetical protein